VKGEVLVIEDDRTLNRVLLDHLVEQGFSAQGTRSWGEAEVYLDEHEPKLVIMDVRLPDVDGMRRLGNLAAEYPVIVLTAYGSIDAAVSAMKLGAAEYLTKPVTLDELDLVIERVLDNAYLRKTNQFYRTRLSKKGRNVMVGESPALQDVQKFIDAVAPNDVTVLIQGESGVGKELVARAIHDRSPRGERDYVAVDCCTLQERLFESEVFGHERGAFTDANKQKKGLIELAECGTLFLDEIGEITPDIQAKLLRFLETGHFRRLGGVKNLYADVRVVAATNRDLEAMIQEGSFRADLYYRLAAFVIQVPSLRERRQDIPALVERFLQTQRGAGGMSKKMSSESLESMQQYDWPGNVRELRNIVERSLILSGGDREIQPCHLSFCNQTRKLDAGLNLTFDYEPTLEEIEQKYLTLLVERYEGHRLKIAQTLGVSERSIYRMVEKHGLKLSRAERDGAKSPADHARHGQEY